MKFTALVWASSCSRGSGFQCWGQELAGAPAERSLHVLWDLGR